MIKLDSLRAMLSKCQWLCWYKANVTSSNFLLLSLCKDKPVFLKFLIICCVCNTYTDFLAHLTQNFLGEFLIESRQKKNIYFLTFSKGGRGLSTTKDPYLIEEPNFSGGFLWKIRLKRNDKKCVPILGLEAESEIKTCHINKEHFELSDD